MLILSCPSHHEVDYCTLYPSYGMTSPSIVPFSEGAFVMLSDPCDVMYGFILAIDYVVRSFNLNHSFQKVVLRSRVLVFIILYKEETPSL